MNHDFLDLERAAGHVRIDPNELKHAAQRGEIDAQIRAGQWYFDHVALDEWAQRHLLAQSAKRLNERHLRFSQGSAARCEWSVAGLLARGGVDLSVAAKAKAGVIRDMTDLADRSGFVYDPESLFRELVAREEAASTAIGAGAAFLHPRFHDPYLFSDSFIAYGRCVREIFFGAPDGAGTRHFFLICSTDHEQHLHILARLAALAHGTDLVSRLDLAVDAAEAIAAVRECETEILK